MAKFRRLPVEIEAVQFTGDNWAEMHDFTGHITVGDREVDFFEAPGNPRFPFNEYDAQAALYHPNGEWQVIGAGDWIIRQAEGFGVLEDHEFQATHATEDEFIAFTGFNPNEARQIDGTAHDARMLGRVQMALLLTRTPEEADAIMNRLMHIVATYKVRNEGATP